MSLSLSEEADRTTPGSQPHPVSLWPSLQRPVYKTDANSVAEQPEDIKSNSLLDWRPSMALTLLSDSIIQVPLQSKPRHVFLKRNGEIQQQLRRSTSSPIEQLDDRRRNGLSAHTHSSLWPSFAHYTARRSPLPSIRASQHQTATYAPLENVDLVHGCWIHHEDDGHLDTKSRKMTSRSKHGDEAEDQPVRTWPFLKRCSSNSVVERSLSPSSTRHVDKQFTMPDVVPKTQSDGLSFPSSPHVRFSQMTNASCQAVHNNEPLIWTASTQQQLLTTEKVAIQRQAGIKGEGGAASKLWPWLRKRWQCWATDKEGWHQQVDIEDGENHRNTVNNTVDFDNDLLQGESSSQKLPTIIQNEGHAAIYSSLQFEDLLGLTDDSARNDFNDDHVQAAVRIQRIFRERLASKAEAHECVLRMNWAVMAMKTRLRELQKEYTEVGEGRDSDDGSLSQEDASDCGSSGDETHSSDDGDEEDDCLGEYSESEDSVDNNTASEEDDRISGSSEKIMCTKEERLIHDTVDRQAKTRKTTWSSSPIERGSIPTSWDQGDGDDDDDDKQTGVADEELNISESISSTISNALETALLTQIIHCKRRLQAIILQRKAFLASHRHLLLSRAEISQVLEQERFCRRRSVRVIQDAYIRHRRRVKAVQTLQRPIRKLVITREVVVMMQTRFREKKRHQQEQAEAIYRKQQKNRAIRERIQRQRLQKARSAASIVMQRRWRERCQYRLNRHAAEQWATLHVKILRRRMCSHLSLAAIVHRRRRTFSARVLQRQHRYNTMRRVATLCFQRRWRTIYACRKNAALLISSSLKSALQATIYRREMQKRRNASSKIQQWWRSQIGRRADMAPSFAAVSFAALASLLLVLAMFGIILVSLTSSSPVAGTIPIADGAGDSKRKKPSQVNK